MGLCVLLCVLLTSASLLRGDSSCMAPSRPVCYKSSRRPDEDFTCQWTPQGGSTAFTYTLHFRNETAGVYEHFYTGEESSYTVGYEQVRLSVPLQVWVSAHRGDGVNCSSANTTVQLDQAVKYPAPRITEEGMKRGDGLLYLEFHKPPDEQAADYEIRYRESGDPNREWAYKSSTTDTAEKLDAFQVSVQQEAAYEVQARRKAKQVRHAEWSDWSEPISMPLRDSSCMAPSRPVCYKSSRRPDEDFTCQWTPQGGSTAFTYTLLFRNETEGVYKHFFTGEESSYTVGYEQVRLSVPLQVWVSAHRGDGVICSSANTTVQLDQAVKYPAPRITEEGMKRGDGLLYLEFHKPPDEQAADYEIRYRESGDPNRAWAYKSSTTDTAEKLDAFQVSVQQEAAYEVQARRKAKQVRHAEWSDWSEPISMPLKLEKPLFVTWDARLIRNNTSRTLRLSWEAPSPGESVGGVKYHLSLVTWPCDRKPTKLDLVNTTHHSLSITLSTANITIYASNNVGQSPSRTVTVPPVPHLTGCPVESTLSKMESVKKKKKLKRICWEWYRLEDGQTRPTKVDNATKKTATDIMEVAAMEDHVRYYYFVHLRASTKANNHTLFSCPVYKTQSTPQVMPGNLTVVNVNTTSLQVCWQPIPVRQQRGFLTHYLLCLSGDCENLPENQTCKTFQHLAPATEYNISVAGATIQGLGPPATETIWTSEDPTTTRTVKKWILIMVFLFCLCLVAACPLLCMRLRKKLPAVPKPVIVSVKYTPTNQEVPPPKEEVHVVTLESMQNTPEILRVKLEEGRLLLKVDGDDGGEESEVERGEEEEEEEETDEEQDERMMNGCDSISLNPNYKRQTLRIQELTDDMTEGTESEVASPVYKNGLFFDVKVELCENGGTSL